MRPFDWYVVAWLLACFLAAVMLVRHRHEFELCQRRYWRFLFQRWKVATFAAATTVLTLAGPYSNDPTWDYIDAFVMCCATFATAPWVIGTLYRTINGPRSWVKSYVAVCVWLLSTSWFYDLYIRMRDGTYPDYWYENLFLSSILYFAGGLYFSLAWSASRGVEFQFRRQHWPERDATTRFGSIFWASVPFMLVVALVVAPFFG